MLYDQYGRPIAPGAVPMPETSGQVSGQDFLNRFKRLRELRKQGVSEEQIRSLGPDLASVFGGGVEAMQNVGQKGQNATKGLTGTLRRAAPLASTASAVLPGAMYAFQEASEGRPAGAAGGAVSSLAAGGLTSMLTAGLRAAPNPILKLAGYAIPAVASAVAAPVGGNIAETAVSAYTGKPPTGKTGTEISQPPRFVDTPLGRINLNESAAMQDAMDRNQKRQVEYYGTMIGMNTSAFKDLTQFQNEQEINMQKAMLPITTKLANDQLTRSQALINTQNNAYLQQMQVGAQANLALGAQRERGATMRQVLATNPYVVALGAPNISIS